MSRWRTRADQAQAVVTARGADSALARELVGLAVAQQQAGVSASIDVTRAKSQLAEAAGQLSSRRISSTSARSISPARWGSIPPRDRPPDTLTAQLGAADVRPTAMQRWRRRGGAARSAAESHAVHGPHVRVGILGGAAAAARPRGGLRLSGLRMRMPSRPGRSPSR